jgi:hypothetical protein
MKLCSLIISKKDLLNNVLSPNSYTHISVSVTMSDGRTHRTIRKLERPESWKDGKAGMTEKARTTRKAGMTGMIDALIY